MVPWIDPQPQRLRLDPHLNSGSTFSSEKGEEVVKLNYRVIHVVVKPIFWAQRNSAKLEKKYAVGK